MRSARLSTPYRLLSYGYDTSVDETEPMEHVVHDFLRRLSDLREDTETEMLPILFIAHSLGGILLKSALAISYDTHDAISNALATALFFGVPSNYVRDYERVATEEVDDAAQTPLMRALRQDLIFLGSTNVKFDEVGLPVKYRCQYFLESAGEVDARELEEGELARLSSQDKVKLSKGHGPMIRYLRRDEPDYQRVAVCVKAAVDRLLADPTTVL
ncbi:hypothetical protein K525DRAFT_288436 [Schizophyllum commune Loenen D]|nr:hypothetical protein K525DRAFT_288436 [Schizophyllum commune Loenen D]